MTLNPGNEMYSWAKDLFPINRSITGNGVRETLRYISKLLPELQVYEVPSGTKVLDWTVPDEWNVNSAWLKDPDGKIIADYLKNNLHLVGYSIPVNKKISFEELSEHLYSIPEQPEAIPYVTSYYSKNWGFCLKHKDRDVLKKGEYEVCIDSELAPGSLSYGELIIPGESKEEIFLSTYICHPSMANNELSGPCVTTRLAQKIIELSNRKYTYRIVFIPETIGSITYVSKNIEDLKSNVIAGFNITCVGDNREYSYLPSRTGTTLSDQAALHVLNHAVPDFKKYSFLDRGSDERQYCAPGVDLPIASMMRSKYGEYPEYHTSLDNLDLISAEGLDGALNVIYKAIESIEKNFFPVVTTLCEPQLGKRNLKRNISAKSDVSDREYNLMNLLAYSDGKNSLLDIAQIINVPVWELYEIVDVLKKESLLE